MFFAGVEFLFWFFPAVLVFNLALSYFKRAQNICLLFFSLLFYAWGQLVFVGVLIVGITINMVIGIKISDNAKSRKTAKTYLLLGIIFHVLVLFAFVYLNPMISYIGNIIGISPIGFMQIIPLMGLGFFTLRAISYITDIYNDEIKPEFNPINLGLYFCFFPLASMGPIMRYADLKEQFNKRGFCPDRLSDGVSRFVIGLFKIVFVAVPLHTVSYHIFNLSAMSTFYTNIPITMAWLGVITFALQVYYVLSSYADMSIGLCKMFGFGIKENFNYPYASRSINEFWKKWHITMIDWFRRYIEKPLAKKYPDKIIFVLLLMWVLIGIWHGAGFSPIRFALWHFTFFSVENIIDFERRKIPKFAKHVYFLLVMLIGWVLFGTANWYHSIQYLGNMFGIRHNGFLSDIAAMFVREYWLELFLALLLATPFARWLKTLASRLPRVPRFALNICYPIVYTAMLIISIVYIVSGRNLMYVI